jgi:hypothetical protein
MSAYLICYYALYGVILATRIVIWDCLYRISNIQWVQRRLDPKQKIRIWKYVWLPCFCPLYFPHSHEKRNPLKAIKATCPWPLLSIVAEKIGAQIRGTVSVLKYFKIFKVESRKMWAHDNHTRKISTNLGQPSACFQFLKTKKNTGRRERN